MLHVYENCIRWGKTNTIENYAEWNKKCMTNFNIETKLTLIEYSDVK